MPSETGMGQCGGVISCTVAIPFPPGLGGGARVPGLIGEGGGGEIPVPQEPALCMPVPQGPLTFSRRPVQTAFNGFAFPRLCGMPC